MENNRKMTLGCGTLILIALIVLIFGNISVDETTKEVKHLRQEVQALGNMVSSQGHEIEEMRKDVRRLLERIKQESQPLQHSANKSLQRNTP